MPPGKPQQPEYLDDHHKRISEFADEYFADDDEERETFVGTLMERRGYQRVQHTSWTPPENSGKNGPGGSKKPGYFK